MTVRIPVGYAYDVVVGHALTDALPATSTSTAA
jgi:hypothetical protein